MVVALILAGGVGSRLGADRPKQFVEILNKPILAYTVEIYQNYLGVDAIEIVCHKSWRKYLDEMVQKYQLTKVRWITDGGETFQDSVINGVKNLRGKISLKDIVMIHYGVAPFTSDAIIADAIKVCEEYNVSVSCTPCYQLIGTNDEGGLSRKWLDRDRVVQISCPQSFRYEYLLDIYTRAEEQGIIEKTEPHTTSLMYALGDIIYQSYGNQTNIKITTKEDLDIFEGYVLMKQKRLLSESVNNDSEG